ncbi:MAG: WYL domain-containing protein [Thiohalocapsa sp.]|nr:WYL domain-containing protein [Thiohalocapsa sp.]
MDKLHRITRLKRILGGRRRPMPLRDIMDAMECSESTARRALYSYRDDFGAPLAYDRKRGGWYLEPTHDDAAVNELPGTWFTPAELHALLAARELLRQLHPGLLADQTAPIAERIEQLLSDRGLAPDELARRVRLIAIGARHCPGDAFVGIANALLARRRLRIGYDPRGRDQQPQEPATREVSPQRLTWYRGNWYLEAWCHRAADLRRFAVERILQPTALDEPARDIPDRQLDRHFAGTFGIFAGSPTATAVLRFTPRRARWVAEEVWHPDQQGSWLPDGRYQLALPYAHTEELLMDILKYGPDCEIAGPPELREAAAEQLRQTLAHYGGTAVADCTRPAATSSKPRTPRRADAAKGDLFDQ